MEEELQGLLDHMRTEGYSEEDIAIAESQFRKENNLESPPVQEDPIPAPVPVQESVEPVQEESGGFKTERELREFLQKEGYDSEQVELAVSNYNEEKKKVPPEATESASIGEDGDASLEQSPIGQEKTEEELEQFTEEHLREIERFLDPVNIPEEERSNTEQLYVDVSTASKVSPDQLQAIKDEIGKEAEGDFGWFQEFKEDFVDVVNPYIDNVLINPQNKFEAAKYSIRKGLAEVGGVEEDTITEEEIKGKYIEDRTDEKVLAAESKNFESYVENLDEEQKFKLEAYRDGLTKDMGHANLIRSKLAEEEYNSAILLKKKLDEREAAFPEEGTDPNDPVANHNSAVNRALRRAVVFKAKKIEGYISDIDETAKDISSAENELDLLKRNYGFFYNLVGKTSGATVDIALGLHETLKSANSIGDNPLIPQHMRDISTFIDNTLFSSEFGKEVEEKMESLSEEIQGSTRRPIALGEINSVGDFGRWASDVIYTQAPNTALMIGTGGAAGLNIMTASAYGGKLNQLDKEEKLTGVKYTELERVSAALMTAGGEYFSEKVTFGILNKTKRYVQASIRQGSIEVLRESVAKNIKSYLIDTVKEGGTEGLAQLSENIADIFILGKKDKNIEDGIFEAIVTGGFMAGFVYKAPMIVSKPFSVFVNKYQQQKMGEMLKKRNRLVLQHQDPNISDASKVVIEKSIAKIDSENDRIVRKILSKVDAVRQAGVAKEIIKVENELYSIRAEYTEVLKDTSLEKDVKEELIEALDKDFREKTAKKHKIIEDAVVEKETPEDTIPPEDGKPIPPRDKETLDTEGTKETLKTEFEKRQEERDKEKEKKEDEKATEKKAKNEEKRKEKEKAKIESEKEKAKEKKVKDKEKEKEKVQKEKEAKEKEKQRVEDRETEIKILQEDIDSREKKAEPVRKRIAEIEKRRKVANKKRDVKRAKLSEARESYNERKVELEKHKTALKQATMFRDRKRQKVESAKTDVARENASKKLGVLESEVKRHQSKLSLAEKQIVPFKKQFDRANDAYQETAVQSAIVLDERRKVDATLAEITKGTKTRQTQLDKRKKAITQEVKDKEKKELDEVKKEIRAEEKAEQRRQERLKQSKIDEEDSKDRSAEDKADPVRVKNRLRDKLKQYTGSEKIVERFIKFSDKTFENRKPENWEKDFKNHIDTIKDKVWFKNLSKEQKEDVLAEIEIFTEGIFHPRRSDIDAETKARERSDSKKAAPSVKKILGETNKTITINEKAALKDQVKMRAAAYNKAVKDTIKDAREKGKDVGGILKEALRGVKLTNAQVVSLTKAAAELTNPTDKQIDTFFNKVAKAVVLGQKRVDIAVFNKNLEKANDNLKKRFGRYGEKARVLLKLDIDSVPIEDLKQFEAVVADLANSTLEEVSWSKVDALSDKLVVDQKLLERQFAEEQAAKEEKAKQPLSEKQEDAKTERAKVLTETLKTIPALDVNRSRIQNEIINKLKKIPNEWLVETVEKGISGASKVQIVAAIKAASEGYYTNNSLHLVVQEYEAQQKVERVREQLPEGEPNARVLKKVTEPLIGRVIKKASPVLKDGLRKLQRIPPIWLIKNLANGEIRDITLNKYIAELQDIEASAYASNIVQRIVQQHEVQLINSNIEDSEVRERVLRPIRNIAHGVFRKLIKNKDLTGEDFAKAMEGTLLQHIDSTIGGLKGTVIYAEKIHDITARLSKAEDTTTKVQDKMSSLIAESKDSRRGKRLKRLFPTMAESIRIKDGNYEFDLNVVTQLYLREREYLTNKSLHPNKVFTARQYVESTIKNPGGTNLRKSSLEQIELIFNRFATDGELDLKKIESYLTPKEMELIQYMDSVIKETEALSRDMNEYVYGQNLDYMAHYFPRDTKSTNAESKAEVYGSFGEFTKTGMRATSSHERNIFKTAPPISFDTFGALTNHVREANIEYNVKRQTATIELALNKMINSKNADLRDLGVGLKKSVEALIETEFGKTQTKMNTKARKVWNGIKKNVFSNILVRPDRFIPDATVQWAGWYATHADKIVDIYRANKVLNKDFRQDFLFNDFASVHASRMGVGTLDFKESKTGTISKVKYRQFKPTIGEGLVDLFAKNKLTDFRDLLSKKYYQGTDYPAINKWNLEFMDEFKAISGRAFNSETYKANKLYKLENQDAIERAIFKADKLTSNQFNTAATQENKLNIQQDTGITRELNSFMKSFAYNENRVIWDSIQSIFGNGSMDRAEAIRTFAFVTARSLGYNISMQFMGQGILTAFGFEEDEDLMEKAIAKATVSHLLLTAVGGRNFAVNIGANVLAHFANKYYVSEMLNEKYDEKKHGVTFTPSKRQSVVQFLSLLGTEGIALGGIYEAGELVTELIGKAMNGTLSDDEMVELKVQLLFMKSLETFVGLSASPYKKALEKEIRVSKEIQRKKKSKKRSTRGSDRRDSLDRRGSGDRRDNLDRRGSSRRDSRR